MREGLRSGVNFSRHGEAAETHCVPCDLGDDKGSKSSEDAASAAALVLSSPITVDSSSGVSGSTESDIGEGGDKRVNEDDVVLGGEMTVVVRVLRSRSVTKSTSTKERGRRQRRHVYNSDNDVQDKLKLGESDDGEGKIVWLDGGVGGVTNGVEEIDDGHKKVVDVDNFANGVGNNLKRKRGKPYRFSSKVQETDHRLDEEMGEDNNPKLGRPAKAGKIGSDEKTEVWAHVDKEDGCERIQKKLNKRKHGKPPKTREADGGQKIRVEAPSREFVQFIEERKEVEVDGGVDNVATGAGNILKRQRGRPSGSGSDFQENHDQFDEKMNEEIKPKLGRPPKGWKSGSDENRNQIDIENGGVGNCLKSKCGRPTGSSSNFQEADLQLDEEMRKENKPKLGRPPKAWKSSSNELETDLQLDEEMKKEIKPKLGRAPKAWKSGSNELEVQVDKKYGCAGTLKLDMRKRGRPPKTQEADGLQKIRAGAPDEEFVQSDGAEPDKTCGSVRKKLKPSSGRSPNAYNCKISGDLRKMKEQMKARHNVCKNTIPVRKESQTHQPVPAQNRNPGSNRRVEGKDSKNVEKEKRSLQKQAVRDKIVDLLLSAGWSVEHRPRNGRAYMDAVYVNPEGRTHWSVTLAYQALKKHYEDRGADLDTYHPGFKFTPIPDEEISMLERVMVKTRSDKNKKRKNKKRKHETNILKMCGVTVKKKNNKKFLSRKMDAMERHSYKMLKGRKRKEPSTCEGDDSDFILENDKAVSGRKLKGRGTNGRNRCALMIRKPQEGMKLDGNGYVLYTGKRTILSWMIDLGSVALDGKVRHSKCRKRGAVCWGRITMNGIWCDCCDELFSISGFEAHAGSKSCQPLKNIYLKDGPSLLQCLLDSWNKQDEHVRNAFHFVSINGEDPNDDACGICGDGGDLICCDACPSTFHQSCLEIKEFPSGVWHCLYCSCKFCGVVDRVNSCQSDDDNVVPVSALHTCCLCEQKYHQSCIQFVDAANVDSSKLLFCGKKCKELYERLQKLIGRKHELEGGFTWSLIRRFEIDSASDITLNGMPRKIECNSKVAVASLIMEECFLPMDDRRSGVNLIRNVVYNFGSNFKRLNYGNFLTAILERGDEIISAASIRIHGHYLAEMPFIGTRHMYRRQGMCRRLLVGIETALCLLNVEKLVIPAISELRETWTSVFGFEPIEGLKQRMRNMNMMAFPGVDMLQKQLLKHHSPEDNTMEVYGLKSLEVEEHESVEVISNHSGEMSSGASVEGSKAESNVPIACDEEAVLDKVITNCDPCNIAVSDATTRPGMVSGISDELCMSANKAPDCYGVDKVAVHDPGNSTTEAQMDEFPTSGELTSEKLGVADSEVDHATLTKCKSESLCNSSSAPAAVAL